MPSHDAVAGANETLDSALSMLFYRLAALFFTVWAVVDLVLSGFTIHTGTMLAFVIACLFLLVAEVRGTRHDRAGDDQ